MVLLQTEDKKAIGTELEGLKEPVKIVAHLPANKNEPNENLKSLVTEIAEMDERISCEVLMEGEDEEVNYVLERRPALVVLDKEGKDLGVIFYGVPVGNTLKSLISLILTVSNGEIDWEDDVKEKASKLEENGLQLLVTPATPRVNRMIDIINKIAYLNSSITSSVIDMTEFPDLAQQHHVLGFPMALGKDELKFTGVYNVEEVIQILQDKISDTSEKFYNVRAPYVDQQVHTGGRIVRRSHISIVILLLIGSVTAQVIIEPRVDGTTVYTMEATTPLFQNVSSSVGLAGVRGDSFVWGDWNADGYQDLLVKGSRLFQNMGPPGYEFKEVTSNVGLENSGYCVWVDLDNDGYLDIFSAGHPYNYQDSVWLNTGPPNFRYRNVSHLSGPDGVDDASPSIASGAGDIDLDGDLDIYVVNWRDDDNVKYIDTLWRNEGGGRFTDITSEAGIVDWNVDREEPNAGMGVNFGDYNDDGWIDIYVSNYLISPNYLWENQGDGTFIDVAQSTGCAGEATRTPTDTYYGHSAGSSWADYDNDGDLDMWTSNLAHKDPYRTLICDNSQLWRNSGREGGYTFTDMREQTGIPTVILEQEELFFGIAWGDYDNDGDLDMWIPQVKSYLDYAYSFLYRNNGDGTFTDVSEEAQMRIWDSDGGAWCDYDNDGDLDLITEGKYPYENATYEVHLFQNQGGNDNHYLYVDLTGGEMNPSAIGARVWAYSSETGDLLGMREVEGGTAGHSYGPSLTQEFGLGDYSGDVSLEIRWPTGNWQYVDSVQTDRKIEVNEPRLVDLAIEVETDDDLVVEGEEIEISVRLSNRGDSDFGAIQVYYHESWEGGSGWEGFEELGPIKIGGYLDLPVTLSTVNRIGSHHLEFLIYTTGPQDMNPENDVASLDLQVTGSNLPPKIIGLSMDTDTVEAGGTLTMEVSAMDPEGGSLDHEFRCPYGVIGHEDLRSNIATWTAPLWYEAPDGLSTKVTVTVTDPEGSSVSMVEDIYVLPHDGPPSLTNITITTSQLPNDSTTPVVMTVEVRDVEGPVVDVSVDLEGFGGRQYETLYDNGLRDDSIAGDGIYTISFTVSRSAYAGPQTVLITALDDSGQSSTAELEVTIVDARENSGSDKGSDSNFDPMILAGVGLFLLFVVIFFLALWRSKRRSE